MKHIYRVVVLVALATFFYASAQAQNAGTVTNHAVPIGKGAGVQGFGSAAPGTSGFPLVSNGASSDPSFQKVPSAGIVAGADGTVKNSSGGSVVDTALGTLVNSACSVAPSLCATAFGYYSPYWYGAACDGTTNDTTAMQNALTAASGSRLAIPAATCAINAHLNVPSSVTISGVDRNLSIIKQTGADYIFSLVNQSNVTISDLYLLGTRSYVSWSSTNFGAIVINNSTSQSNNTFRRLKLTNFNANYWIYGTQSGGVTSYTTLDNIWITSVTADIPTDGVSTNNSNFGIVLQSGTGGVRWENTTVNDIQVDGTGLCFGVVLYSNFYKFRVTNGRFLSMGGANTGSHCTNGLGATNAYGISVYDLNADGNPPTDGIISGNYILNPIAAGIYVVGDGGATYTRVRNSIHTLITNNEIIGQTHSDTLLARGAIAVSYSTDVDVVGNLLYNNQIGINIASQNSGDLSVRSNHVSSVSGGAIGLQLVSGANGSSNSDRRSIRSNYFDAVTAITATSATGSRFNFIDVSDNAILATTTTIGFGSQFVSGAAVFSNNFLGGTGTPSFASITGTLTLQNNSGLSFTAATLPATSNGSNVFVSDGTPATACTAAGTGSTAFRQNGAWKCF